MSTASVAVVIPTLSGPGRLRDCLRSVLEGALLPEQIAVCDQTPGEQARAALKGIGAPGVELLYLHLARPNASAARNAGLHLVRTDLVAFTDDDCLADRGWLKALVGGYTSAMGDEEVAAVTGRVLPFQRMAVGSVATSSRTSAEKRYFRACDGGLARGDWAPWDAGTGGNILAPRTALEAVRGFDVRLGPGTRTRAAEDIDLLYRLAKAGTIVYEPAAVVYHPAATRKRRLSSRYHYGFGMAAMLVRHMARGDSTARALLIRYLRHQAAQSLRHGRWGPVESILTLAGASAGVLTQWRGGRGAGSP